MTTEFNPPQHDIATAIGINHFIYPRTLSANICKNDKKMTYERWCHFILLFDKIIVIMVVPYYRWFNKKTEQKKYI